MTRSAEGKPRPGILLLAAAVLLAMLALVFFSRERAERARLHASATPVPRETTPLATPAAPTPDVRAPLRATEPPVPRTSTAEVDEPTTRTLTGRVLRWEDRAPIEGARVTGYDMGDGNAYDRARSLTTAPGDFTTTTGPDGGFSLDMPFVTVGIRGISIRVVVVAGGLQPGYGGGDWSSAGVPMEFVLLPGGTLAGRVVDAFDRPVSGAEVTRLHEYRDESAPGDFADVMPRTVTDRDGRFRFDGLDAEFLQVLQVEARGFPTHVSDMMLVGTEDNVVVLSGAPTTVSGRVMWADQTPAKGALVHIVDTTETLRPFPKLRSAEVDADGRYRIDGVPRGPWLFLAGFHSYDQKTSVQYNERIEVRPGEEMTIDVTFPPLEAKEMSGRVIDRETGKGVGGVLASLDPWLERLGKVRAPLGPHEAITDAEGWFRLTRDVVGANAPASFKSGKDGFIRLAPPAPWRRVHEFHSEPRAPAEYLITRLGVAGIRVLQPDGTTPAVGASIRGAALKSTWTTSGMTDDLGTWRFLKPPPPNACLWIAHSSGGAVVDNLPEGNRESADLIEVVLKPFGTVEGQFILLETSEPISGISVTLSPVADPTRPSDSPANAVLMLPSLLDALTTASRGDGRFRFDQLPPGTYQPSIRAIKLRRQVAISPGHGRLSTILPLGYPQTVTVGAGETSNLGAIFVTDPKPLRLSLRYRDGTPVSNARPYLKPSSNGPYRWMATDGSGEYSFTPSDPAFFEEGPFTLHIARPDSEDPEDVVYSQPGITYSILDNPKPIVVTLDIPPP